MSTEQKTFIINTMSEATYLELSARGVISDKQLNIVDDNDTNRTVVASYDLVREKAGAKLEYVPAVAGGTPWLILKNDHGAEISKIDISDFVKEGTLNGLQYCQSEDILSSYGLKFSIKMPDGTVSAVYIQTTDDAFLSTSTNAVTNRTVVNRFMLVEDSIKEIKTTLTNTTKQKIITSSIGTAEIFNEEDGGGSKFTTYDNKLTSYVGVNNPNQSGSISGIAGQLYVVGNQRTKLNMYDGEFCYIKGDNPTTDEEKSQRELVVRSDIDEEIDALSNVYLSKVDGGAVSSEMSVKGGLTIKDSSLFIPFRTGPYSNLSIGNTAFLIENVTDGGTTEITVSYPSADGTLAVKSDVDNAICALTNNISGAKSQTVTKITETSGIISATFDDISIAHTQISDWDTEINSHDTEIYRTIYAEISDVTSPSANVETAICAIYKLANALSFKLNQ